MQMYEVCAKCGHVGRNNYVEKIFAIKAMSGKEAAALARAIPRVKHNHNDAIRSVEIIDDIRFSEIIEQNANDPYFTCTNIQEQRAYCDLEIFPEEDYIEDVFSKTDCEYATKYYKKQALRHPKKYINNYLYEQEYMI